MFSSPISNIFYLLALMFPFNVCDGETADKAEQL